MIAVTTFSQTTDAKVVELTRYVLTKPIAERARGRCIRAVPLLYGQFSITLLGTITQNLEKNIFVIIFRWLSIIPTNNFLNVSRTQINFVLFFVVIFVCIFLIRCFYSYTLPTPMRFCYISYTNFQKARDYQNYYVQVLI